MCADSIYCPSCDSESSLCSDSSYCPVCSDGTTTCPVATDLCAGSDGYCAQNAEDFCTAVDATSCEPYFPTCADGDELCDNCLTDSELATYVADQEASLCASSSY